MLSIWFSPHILAANTQIFIFLSHLALMFLVVRLVLYKYVSVHFMLYRVMYADGGFGWTSFFMLFWLFCFTLFWNITAWNISMLKVSNGAYEPGKTFHFRCCIAFVKEFIDLCCWFYLLFISGISVCYFWRIKYAIFELEISFIYFYIKFKW